MPAKYAVDGGFICDIRGHSTPQLDFIIADTTEIPKLALSNEKALVPPEAALATVEIKSTLRSSDKEQIKKQVESIKDLEVITDAENLGISYAEYARFVIPTFIFAFDTDMNRDAVDDWFTEIDNLAGICIFDNYYKIKHGGQQEDGTYKVRRIETILGEEYSETLIFSYSLLRAVSQIAKLRSRFLPVLPLYVRGVPESWEMEPSPPDQED